MTDDTRLIELVREALPPVPTIDDRPVRRDLWPVLERRTHAPVEWSWTDVSLAAAVALALLMFREHLVVLAFLM